jgi:hypothetical protein
MGFPNAFEGEHAMRPMPAVCKISLLVILPLVASIFATPHPSLSTQQVSAASYSLTFPQVVNGLLGGVKYQTNIFLLNNSAANATGTVYLYRQDGSPMTVSTNRGQQSSYDFKMAPGASFHLETDGRGDAVVGWVEVLSDIALSGSGSFVVNDAAGAFQTEVGIGDSVRGRNLMLHVNSNAQEYTGFAVCNPSAAGSANLSYELRRADGSLVTSKSGVTLRPRGQNAEFVNQTFPSIAGTSFNGILVIKSPDQDVAVTTLRSHGANLTSLPSVPFVSDTGKAGELLFSRIADGQFGSLKYTTGFILLNNSTRSTSATVDLVNDKGAPLSLNIGGSRKTSFIVTIPAGGAVELTSDGSSSPASTGWASVKSDLPISGGALFTSNNVSGGTFVAQVGVPASPSTSRASIYGQVQGDIDTAFAINNLEATPQNFTLRLLRSESSGGPGTVLLEKTLTLAAKNHTAVFLSGAFADVFDVLRKNFEGWLEIEGEAGKKLNALTLRTRGASLTSLPVAPFSTATDRYSPQTAVAPTATAESKSGTLTASAKSVALSDGTQVAMSRLAGANTITLSLQKQTNTLQTGSGQMTTSGAMRVLQVTALKHDASFDWEQYAPNITIPVREAGSLNAETVQILRIGTRPDTGADSRHFLPVTRDSSGNLIFKDPWLPDDIYDDSSTSGFAESEFSAAALPREVKYVPVTFQGSLNYARAPMLLRMVPDSSATAKRRPITDLGKEPQDIERKKPVQNVIVLVHGHNENEKGGIYTAEIDRPWYFAYKRDVWTPFYDSYLTNQSSRNCATVFYEFIYPTYRNIFGGLDQALASALAQELGPQLTNNLKFNLFVVAHSMGGLVSRGAVRNFEPKLLDNLRRLVTWGSPHLGSSLYSFRMALADSHYSATSWLKSYIRRELRKSLENGVIVTPGMMDLRWVVPGEGGPALTLGNFFANSSGDSVYDLNNSTFLYNKNLVLMNGAESQGSKYTFLYGLTSKGLPNFTGDTAADWQALSALTSDLGKGATLNRWLSTFPNDPYEGAKRGDSDGAVPIPSMLGAPAIQPPATKLAVGDIDHEEYFNGGAKATTTANATFDAVDFENKTCDCPTMEITKPAPNETFKDDDTVRVEGKLTWPGDEKPGYRIREIVIRTAANDHPLGTIPMILDDGFFRAEFRAGDLGIGGPAIVGLKVVLVFKDNTELAKEVILPLNLPMAIAKLKVLGNHVYSNHSFLGPLFDVPGVVWKGNSFVLELQYEDPLDGYKPPKPYDLLVEGSLSADGTKIAFLHFRKFRHVDYVYRDAIGTEFRNYEEKLQEWEARDIPLISDPQKIIAGTSGARFSFKGSPATTKLTYRTIYLMATKNTWNAVNLITSDYSASFPTDTIEVDFSK